MTRAWLLLSFILSWSALSQEQPDQDPLLPLGVIDTVIIMGNETTREYVILDEMTLLPRSVATRAAMAFDRNRIYNLGLFTEVDVLFDSVGTSRTLFVIVKERWHLLPFPMFGFRDGDPDRFYYGGGVMHNNLGGRNQKLYAALMLGYDPSASLSFVDPLIDRESSLFGSASFSFSRLRNRSRQQAELGGDFNENHYTVLATLGKRLSRFRTVGITLGYRSVSVEQYVPGRTASPTGKDDFPVIALAYMVDTRDLAEYATRGSLFALSATQHGLGSTDVSWLRGNVEVRGFLPLPGSVTLAGRWFGSFIAGRELPSYGRAFFGFGERVRGHYRQQYEGENQMVASAELRFFLLEPTTIYGDWLPIPQQFAVWRFGISLALFADAGTLWFRGERPALSSTLAGAGAGMHFLLPYGFVARVEHAWNRYGKSQWIIDFRTVI